MAGGYNFVEDDSDTWNDTSSEDKDDSVKFLLRFQFDLQQRENFFTLYLGPIITALFMLIAFISLVKKRQHSVVIQLAKPDTDAHVHEYIVMMNTSFLFRSGLTRGARVAIQLLGSFGDSKRFTLTQEVMKQNILQRAHCDIFVLYMPMSIGNVRTLQLTLFNFSSQKIASWKPCFIEVMKSSTRERWGVCVKRSLTCQYITTKSFHLIKGLRNMESIFKMIVKNHAFTSPFCNPQRFGAYTPLVSVVFFFFSLSVLLMSTMCSFILANRFLGIMSNAEFISHFLQDVLAITIITALATCCVLQQCDIFLMSIRPSPSRFSLRVWRGLWKNDYPADIMHCDVDYDWDQHPVHFRHWADKFSTQESVSSQDSTSESSESSLMLSDESSSEEEEGSKAAGVPVGSGKDHVKAAPTKVTRPAALKMLRHCMKLSKQCHTDHEPDLDQHQAPTLHLSFASGDVLYTGENTVMGTTVTRLESPLPGVYCQFCLWVKHMTIRGEDLYGYTIALSHQVRRAIQALRVTRDGPMAIRVMTLCLNQWSSSLCTRMLKEALLRVDREQLDPGGLQHVHANLLACKSNLWFTEMGYKEGTLAGVKQGDNSHIVSNLYFSIMRHLVTSFKNIQKGRHSILKRPDRDLCPPPIKKKQTTFHSKVQQKSIVRVADLIAMMKEEKEIDEKQKQKETERDAARKASKDKTKSQNKTDTIQSASGSTVDLTTPGRKNTNQSASGDTVKESSDGKSAHQSASSKSKTATSCHGENNDPSTSKATPSGGSNTLCQSGHQSSMFAKTVAPKVYHSSLQQECEKDRAGPSEKEVCVLVIHNTGRVLVTDQSSSEGGHLMAHGVQQALAVRGQRPSTMTPIRKKGNFRDADVTSRGSSFSPKMDILTFPTDLTTGHLLNSNTSTTDSFASSSLSSSGDPMESYRNSQNSNVKLRKRNTDHARDHDKENTCNSHPSPIHNERDRCNSAGANTEADLASEGATFAEKTIRRMSTQVMQVFKRKTHHIKEAKPETVYKLLAAFESYANVVQLEVEAPFGTSSCFCCARAMCQHYAVVYSQFKEYSYRVLHHLAAHYISNRHHTDQENATVSRQYKKITATISQYLLHRAKMMQKMGRPQNQDAMQRLEEDIKRQEKQKQDKQQDKEASSSYSYGSLDSMDHSSNNPARVGAAKGRKGRTRTGFTRRSPGHRRGSKWGFEFGRRKEHHGLILNWDHVPYPFTAPSRLPPVRINWSEADHEKETHQRDEQHGSSEVDSPSRTENRSKASTVESSPLFREDPEHGNKGVHKLVKRMLRQCIREVAHEASWVLGLKESLASVVAFARIDVMKEVHNPLKIAIRNFTHAVIVLLFEAMLPQEEEENFVVTPDDIRQRRKRVSSNRTPGLFDLTEANNPGYDLNFLDFVVVNLCEKWELAKVELQHQPTLEFLVRCLTIGSLDTELMKRLDTLILEPHKGDLYGLYLDRMTHVHETQHSMAVVINEVMAMTLVYVVPETLKAMDDMAGWLKNEEERVSYVCEKVCVLENQVRHKLSRRVLQVAARDVQDQLIVFARRQEKINRRSDKMMGKLRELVKEDYYYTCLNKNELTPIKKDLKELRDQVDTIHRVHTFQQARKVRKYTQNTSKLEAVRVREALCSLTDSRDQDAGYTMRQMDEVEWLMTGQTDKPFPAIFMDVAIVFMLCVTLINLILVTILGAGFPPVEIGDWFGEFVLVVGLMIFVSEPLKCIWLIQFGWRQPEL